VAEVPVGKTAVNWRLQGCGEGFSENLAWQADRADSPSAALDGRYLRNGGGAGAVVYVLDSGVMRDHDEFARAGGSVVIAGFDPATPLGFETHCATSNMAIEPCWFSPEIDLQSNAHGTAVASVIAGLHTGIAPDARIVSIRTQTSSGTSVRVYRDALDDIVRHAWDPTTPGFQTAIVNLSGGLPMPSPDDVPLAEIESRIQRMIGGVDRDGRADAAGKRFLFVVAAGNMGEELGPVRGQCSLSGQVLLWPAVLGPAIEGLVTVGGSMRNDRWWSGSCGGPAVEVAAPAADLLVATITARDHYRGPAPDEARSGTSYATAYVSGIAARLLETDPSATPAELERQLEASPSRIIDGGRLPVPVIAPVSTPRRRIAGAS